MELTHSQYGALVNAFSRALADVLDGPPGDIVAIRTEAEERIEDAATAAYEQIREDPRESTGWNSEVWDNLIVGLVEDDYAASGIDKIARRAAEIAGVPLPDLPTPQHNQEEN